MYIIVRISENGAFSSENEFSFDLIDFDYILDSRHDSNELNFSRILDGRTNTTCIEMYKCLTEKLKGENEIKCYVYDSNDGETADVEVVNFIPEKVSYYIKTLDDKHTQMEYVNVNY